MKADFLVWPGLGPDRVRRNVGKLLSMKLWKIFIIYFTFKSNQLTSSAGDRDELCSDGVNVCRPADFSISTIHVITLPPLLLQRPHSWRALVTFVRANQIQMDPITFHMHIVTGQISLCRFHLRQHYIHLLSFFYRHWDQNHMSSIERGQSYSPSSLLVRKIFKLIKVTVWMKKYIHFNNEVVHRVVDVNLCIPQG